MLGLPLTSPIQRPSAGREYPGRLFWVVRTQTPDKPQ